MTDRSNWENSTKLAQAGIDKDSQYGAVTPTLVPSSNFSFEKFGHKRPYDYTRTGNPTRDTLGRIIADLEGGANAVVTATGLAAVYLVLTDLKPNDLVLAPHDCYGGTYRLLSERAKLGHFRIKFADLTDPDKYDEAFSEPPKLVLIETPSNPLLRITDVEAVSKRAKAVGALVVADNTFLSPVLQKPLELGVDVVVHSLTKYINGHGDVVGGAVISQTKEQHARFAFWANVIGLTGAPFDSWLVLRGIRTLEVRINAQTEAAGTIAEYLSKHPDVARVYYPGLVSHPGHDLAKKQQKGFGAMLSFELAKSEKVESFVNHLTGPDQPFCLAESLGGFESLIAHPATMTHLSMDPEARRAAGISDRLLRVSIGLESARDLTKAFESAFQASKSH